jgi:trimethylamine:corrinoid methyltransferase-like protein
MLGDYEAPALDSALDEQLQAYMAKRKEVLPDGVS